MGLFNKKRLKFLLSIIFVIIDLFVNQVFSASEREWQEAWNNKYAHGKLEVEIPYGRIDILTDDYAIEIDHVYKFHEGIGQALHYAYETNKKPGLALFMDDKRDTREKYEYVKKLAESLGIKVWLINDIVNLKTETETIQTPILPFELKKDNNKDNKIVYITRTGSKYHRIGCSYLRRSCIPISKKDAIAHGYTPCSRCKP